MDSVDRLWRRRAPPSEGLQLVVPVRERHDLIQRFHDSFGGYTHDILLTGWSLLARSTKRRLNVHSIVHDLPGAEVTLPAKGPNGTCRSGA